MVAFDSDSTPVVLVQPLGEVAAEHIEAVRAALETHFVCVTECGERFSYDYRIQVHPSLGDEYDEVETLETVTFDENRDQYDAGNLLRYRPPVEGHDYLLTVTDRDIYYRRRHYVFGLAEFQGEAAVLSTARFDTEDADSETVTARVRKEAINQFGKLRGTKGCDSDGCVMGFSPTVTELDGNDEYVCDDCTETIGDEALR